MAMLAQLYDNGRAAERHALDADATLRGEDQMPVDVLVADLSSTGCLFVCAADLPLGAEVTIGIAGVGRRTATIVRTIGQRYGCAFTDALSEAEITRARTDPAATIVDFPAWSHPIAADEELPPVAKLSGAARLAILGVATGAGWGTLLLAARLLHHA